MPVVLLLFACGEGDTVDSDPVTPQDSVVSTAETGDSGPEQIGGVALPKVLINELVAENTGSALPPDGTPADWLELYNPNDAAIALDGYHLSDDWRIPDRFTLPAGTVIDAGGYLLFWADGDTSAGADHLNFVLGADGDAVGLFTPDEESMDWVLFPALGDDVAHARLPDGGDDWAQVAIGTPGAMNQDLVKETQVAVAAGSVWAYHDRGIDLGTAWLATDYDDAGWARGPAPLGYGDSQTTELSYGDDRDNKRPCAYFRTSFELSDPSWVTQMTADVRRDDGAAVYLNGVEVLRTAMPSGELTYDTWADTTASGSDETTYFPFDLDPALLVAGTNVVAVEVHQVGGTSSDLTWDAQVELIGLTERE